MKLKYKQQRAFSLLQLQTKEIYVNDALQCNDEMKVNSSKSLIHAKL